MSTQYRWYVPQTAQDAIDTVENCRNIIRFLTDNLTQEGFKPGSEYSLTEEGTSGLYLIHSFVNDILGDCIDKIQGGLRHANN